ncbi:MAG: 4Fe-4S binding protein [Paludibacter sp.]|nr:4Fe-4S binding protein [Paludibacter sp.]
MNDKCTGCGMCVIICPQACIILDLNEKGFYHPVVNESRCTDCGKCISVCYKCSSFLLTKGEFAFEHMDVFAAIDKNKVTIQRKNKK